MIRRGERGGRGVIFGISALANGMKLKLGSVIPLG